MNRGEVKITDCGIFWIEARPETPQEQMKRLDQEAAELGLKTMVLGFACGVIVALLVIACTG
jgi:hypothetical protein